MTGTAYFEITQEDYDDVARLAAAYAFGLVGNHGFSDGNKRAALVTADLFLMLNGYELDAFPVENVLVILGAFLVKW